MRSAVCSGIIPNVLLSHLFNHLFHRLLEFFLDTRYIPLFYIFDNALAFLCRYSNTRHKVFYGNSAYNTLYNSFHMGQTYLYQFVLLAFS